MFVPPQRTLPIKAEPRSETPFNYSMITYCNGCYQDVKYKYITKKGDPQVVWRDSTVWSICDKCHRYRKFDYWTLIKNKSLIIMSQKDWWTLKEEFKSKYPLHIANHLYKWCRAQRYNQQIEISKDWEQQFSEDEVSQIWDLINDLIKDYHCVDNIRVANKNISNQRKRYRHQRKQGCCGSFDTEIGNYWIGFNYGH